jgi:hypothetical protein
MTAAAEAGLPPVLADLLAQIDRAEADARALVAPLTVAQLNWQPLAGRAWSIGQCLDHLRAINLFYVRDFGPLVEAARQQGVAPFAGLEPSAIGRWFVRTLEPPPPYRARAPKRVRPASMFAPDDLLDAYVASHGLYRALVRQCAAVDVNRLRVRNPFFPVLRMRMATVLQVIPAHDRRHLWQAAQVRAARGFPD